MEAIFEVLFEIVGEFLLQVVFEALSQAGVHLVRNPDKPPPVHSAWLRAMGYCVFGAIGGGVSLIIVPHNLLPHTALRVAYLLIAPVLIGALLSAIAHWRSRRSDRPVLDIDRFGNGWLFAFTFAFIRFMFAH
jgi:hypothetical protein